MELKFNGCKHLDFEDHYHAKKQVLSSGTVFWLRDVPSDLPAMVQFCKLRGRLNFPQACMRLENAACNDFEQIEHVVNVEDD